MMAPSVTTEFEKLSVNGSTEQKKVAGRTDIQLGDITHHNVLQLKKLNQAVFPVTYNDKFYTEVVSAGELAKFVYFNDVVVGAVCCRPDTYQGEKSLYIMTLGTLAPYRQFGVGKILLNHVFDICKKDANYKNVYLHVQTNNETALNFYSKYNFKKAGVAEKYYRRIDPDDAFILVKNLKE